MPMLVVRSQPSSLGAPTPCIQIHTPVFTPPPPDAPAPPTPAQNRYKPYLEFGHLDADVCGSLQVQQVDLLGGCLGFCVLLYHCLLLHLFCEEGGGAMGAGGGGKAENWVSGGCGGDM
jgi:hypothetical protein